MAWISCSSCVRSLKALVRILLLLLLAQLSLMALVSSTYGTIHLLCLRLLRQRWSQPHRSPRRQAPCRQGPRRSIPCHGQALSPILCVLFKPLSSTGKLKEKATVQRIHRWERGTRSMIEKNLYLDSSNKFCIGENSFLVHYPRL